MILGLIQVSLCSFDFQITWSSSVVKLLYQIRLEYGQECVKEVQKLEDVSLKFERGF